MAEALITWLSRFSASAEASMAVERLVAFGLLLLVILLSNLLSRKMLVPLLERAVRRSNTRLDDIFIAKGFFSRVARLLPVVVLYLVVDLLFPNDGAAAELLKRLAMVLLALVGVWVLDAALQATFQILNSRPALKDKPLRGYTEAVKIVSYILASIFVVSVLTGQSPWGVLSVLGGLTAVLLLIFKDTILGFVANLRLASNDMVRVGDWIEMPKYDANGDVMDVSIHTVKVRNWDKTITNIPTHVLIADNFKNWRGMQESGGRRIKRALLLDMSSIRFCTPEMLERFGRFTLITDYIRRKQEEIETYNQECGAGEQDSETPNGRRQTNIGVFRAYVSAYLRAHPRINQEMTFLVRHLDPTPQGMPLEIYVFTNDTAWAHYEAIQADIFDHILAAVELFDLRLFQYPSGHDLRGLPSAAPAAEAARASLSVRACQAAGGRTSRG